MKENQMGEYTEISDFVGKVFTNIEVNKDEDTITFNTVNESFKMFHVQNCCEAVSIEDISGDLIDLIGNPILTAYKESNNEPSDKLEEYEPGESQTWTFYRISTIKGTVTIRWYGTSNGYYSEDVDIFKFTPGPV